MSGLGKGLKIGSLGGPQTFGDQATRQLMGAYPEFTEIVYFETAEELFDAVLEGKVAASCAPEQMAKTGFHPKQQGLIAAPDSKLHVAAETEHVYHCALLGKPGASMARLRRVIGHTGSVTQSRGWLERNLPGVSIEIVHTNSRTAARTVMEGDGSIASVGTPAMAGEYGLVELAQDIDEGSVGNYWAISREPFYSESPDRVIVSGRFGDDGRLSRVVCGLADAGFALRSVFSTATGRKLYEYDYVLSFTGKGALAVVRAAVEAAKPARLAGAYEARG